MSSEFKGLQFIPEEELSQREKRLSIWSNQNGVSYEIKPEPGFDFMHITMRYNEIVGVPGIIPVLMVDGCPNGADRWTFGARAISVYAKAASELEEMIYRATR